ncbi:axonemal dynein light chain domain-containing protein 1-like isoform X2 [Xenia sp. Carnegie-2017]|nr:axonemal dynein light chain domain-containing protein 1-like isoform X2 [Xenia sp. Carnegie-2017]
MKPTSRQEVLKLKHAFEAMLSRAGVEDNFKELSGPTQIHNLLELVKKEQNIYNIVFNELIRQCTIECVERGELLANLRQKYVQLLDRIPRQVMSLHQEVLAQRALDRRLTEELMRFKENVSSLTSELNAVKDHDNAITKQAEQIQQELNEALLESEKNANLLEEYHELYDLQRKRLETFVHNLSEDRDLWSSATYILALKVVDHHKLNVAKRLHLHERAWSKLMTHFSLILSQKDSEQLQEVVNSFQSWKDLAEKFFKQMIKDEENLKSNLDVAVNQLLKWKKEFQKFISSDGGHVQVPEKILIEELLCDMKSWEEMCSKEGEKFTGGSLLSSQEHLILLYHKVEEWTDVAHKIFRRHTFCDRNVIYTEEMMTLNKIVEKLHQQFQIRVSGENGVAKGLICISNRMESWCNKLQSVVNGGDELLDSEWTRLAEQVGNEWLENINEVKYIIGSQIKEDERKENDESQNSVDFNELCKLSRKWLTNMTNSIENDDGKLLQTVNDLHTTMLKWMVTVLIRLAPNLDNGELEKIDGNDNFKGALGGSEILLESTSLQIQNRRACLVDELRTYTKVIKDACTSFVMESTLEKKNRYEDDAEAECNDLKRISRECEGWVWASEVLLKQVVGELPVRGVDVEELLAKPSSDGLNKDKERSLRDLEEEAITKQDNSVKSIDLESEKETSAVAAVTTEDNDEDDKKESVSSDVTKIKVIAEDETVTTKELKHIDDVKEESTAEINDASFKALETVERLQNELIEAEKRSVSRTTMIRC